MARKDKQRKAHEKLRHSALSAFKGRKQQSLSFKEISEHAGARDKARQKLLGAVLNDLVDNGQLERVGKGRFAKKRSVSIEGIIKMNARGFGYFSGPGILDEIKIGDQSCGQALNGDTVEVELLVRNGKSGTQGRVLRVVERARTRFVGTIQKNKGHTFLIPDDNKIHIDFFIPKDEGKGVKDEDKAIAELREWPESAGNPFASIVEVLGPAGDHEVEMISILAEHGLPHAFPPAVEKAAAEISTTLPEANLKDRRDLRDLITLTIDPHDAKDLDDAISYRKLENGAHEVGVHIADVSHYIKPGGLIDKEAYKRATSVYLVDRVVPMLPEKLSNGVCSLNDDTDKLCFSAIFEMNDKGGVLKEWFGRTVIRSNKRFSYEEAQEVLEKKKGPFSKEILALGAIARTLRKNRLSSGSLNMSSTEVKFQLDDDNNPVGVVEKKMKEANFMIEDLMLLANKRVARFVAKKKGGKAPPFIYRVHDNPDPEKLRTLKIFVEKFGHKLKLGSGKPSAALNALLAEIEGTDEADIIRQLTIRSMAKAEYSTDNIGHFGLAFHHYTHFTSPIRRYPDLMVHRALAHYLADGKNLNAEELEKRCKHTSSMERKATAAERDSVKHMQALFLSEHLGEQFEGMVSGLARWGVYIQMDDILCEGLLALRDIPGDHFNFDERNFRVVGSRTGEEFNMGDRVVVTVNHVDLERKTIDLNLVERA